MWFPHPRASAPFTPSPAGLHGRMQESPFAAEGKGARDEPRRLGCSKRGVLGSPCSGMAGTAAGGASAEVGSSQV